MAELTPTSPNWEPLTGAILCFGEFRLDVDARKLYRGAQLVAISPKPFYTLIYLAENRHRVVPKEELLEKIWREERVISVVEQAVRQIRRVLEDDVANPSFIQTVTGHGYRFVAEIVLPRVRDVAPTRDVDPPAAERNRISRRAVWAGIGGAAIVTAGVAARMFGGHEQPERAVLSGNLLTALDGLGRPIWKYRFPGRLLEAAQPQDSLRVQVLDLEGEGRPGVLVTCSFASGSSPAGNARDELFYFGWDGKVRWTLPCEPGLLDSNGGRFEPGWFYTQVFALPSAGKQILWAGVGHLTRFPGCVLRIDHRGKSRVQVVNPGHVQRVCAFRSNGADRIVFAGVNNAIDRNCIGVVGADDPPCIAPVIGPDRYRFANGPKLVLDNYFLLPTVELTIIGGNPYGEIHRLYREGERILLEVDLLTHPNLTGLVYQFSDELMPDVVVAGGSSEVLHRQLEQQGVLQHSWSQCPDLAKPLKLRHFTSRSGWKEEDIRWRLPSNRV